MVNRDPLRNQIRRAVLEDIIDGSLAPGARVSLAALAGELDVSPTPAREALTQLEREGFLTAEPNRGFFVAPLRLAEAQDVYPIIWTLEALAVKLQGPPAAERIQVLSRLNAELARAEHAPEEALRLDQAWHEALVAPCPNLLVLKQIEALKQRALRYELAFMRASGRIPFSVSQHDEILNLYTAHRPERVAGSLEAHWKTSLAFLERWLREQRTIHP